MTQPVELITRARFEVDENGRKRLRKAFSELSRDAKQIVTDKDAEALGRRFAKVAKSIGLPRGAVIDLRDDIKQLGLSEKQVASVSRGFLEMYKNAKRADDEVSSVARTLEDYEQRRRALDAGGGALSGNLASTFANSRGAFDALTGGNAGAASSVLELGEAIADLGEFVPRAVNELGTLGRVISESKGFLGQLSGGFQSLIPGLSGSAAGLAAVAVPLAAVAAVGAATAIVLDQINRAIEKRLELEKQTSAVFDAQIAAQSEANQALDELNGERIKAQLETALEEERIATETARNRAERFYEAQALFYEYTTPLSGSFDLVKGKEQADVVNQLSQEFDEAANAAQTAATVTQVWRDAAEQYEAVGGDAAQTTAELVEQTNKLKAEQAQLAAIEQQAVAATATFNKETRRIADDRKIAAVRDEEDFNERIADIRAAGAKRIESIEKQGQARLAAIRSDLSDLPRKLAADLSEAESKAADDRRKILRDFADDATADYEKFVLKENQIRRKANLDRLRLEEDFQDRLNDAASEGDVEAFLRAQREREKALTRQAEDIGTEAQTRAENFTQEQEQRRQDLQRRLEDLRTSLAQERAEIRANYEQRRGELLEQLEAEKTALKENVAAAYAAINEQEQALAEDRKKRLQRQAEDEKRADAERDRQHREELNKINERQRAIKLEARATDDLVKGANKLAAAAAAFKSAAAGAGTTAGAASRSSSSRASKSTKRGLATFAFAEGGLALATPGGVPAILAERGENELAIPVGNATGQGAVVEAISRLRGAAGGRGGMGISITIQDHRTVMVGDIASVSAVENALIEMNDLWTKDALKAFEQGRYGVGAT